MVSWKACWLTIASVVVLALAVLPPHLGASPLTHRLVALAAGIALCGAWWFGVTYATNGAEMWTKIDPDDRVLIAWCLRAAGIAYALLLAITVSYPDLLWLWVIILAALDATCYWTAQAVEYVVRTRTNRVKAHKAAAEQHRSAALEAVAAALEPTRETSAELEQFRQALRAAKLSHLRVIDVTPLVATPGETPFGRRYRVRRGPNNEDLRQSHGEAIAIALADITGRRYLSDQVEVLNAQEAGEFDILVSDEDIMARIYPHTEPPRPVPATITEPREIGFGTDAAPVRLNLKRHGRITAGTTGGKSSLVDEIIALLTECSDVRIWICGTHKLYDLVAAWCDVYRDTGLPIPFDWVRFGPQHTADMLAAFLRTARYRQSLPMRERGGWATIILILDEASYVLDKNNPVLAEFDGMKLRTPALTGHIFRGVASADQNMLVVTQRDTIDQLGDDGGLIQSNLGYDIVGRSTDRDAVGRVAGSWDLRKPRHPGQFWLVDFDKPGPVQVKVKYPQTDDPTKPLLVKPGEGMKVSEIAWSRRLLPHHGEGLDAGSAQAAGPAYLNRPRLWDDRFEAYLQGAGPEPQRASGDVTRPALTSPPTTPTPTVPAGPPASPPGHDGTTPAPAPMITADNGIAVPAAPPDLDTADPTAVYDQTMANLRAQFADLLPPDPTAGAEGPGNPAIAPVVPEQAQRGGDWSNLPTRAERIVAVVREWQGEGPVPRAKIIAELHEMKDLASDQVVSNALTKLVGDGVLERHEGGGYTVTDSYLTNTQTHSTPGGVMTR